MQFKLHLVNHHDLEMFWRFYMNVILTATEIDTWAKAYPRHAQELLPQLIARLVLCSSPKIVDYNFPIEKGIQFAGYDGVLKSGEATSYFPEGKSVWEFGTNDNALEKFRSDIEKRHSEPLDINIADTTFIFVTLKIWNHRKSIEETVNESKNRYNWKDVRIIDASKIALWLQSHDAVAVWFANSIGKHIDGIRTIEDFWSDHCESTSPKLGVDYFLLGRDSQISKLSEWLEKKSGSLTLVSESALESTLFIAALFLSQKEKYSAVINKTLIIESTSVWHDLVRRYEKDGLYIPVFNFTEDIRCPREMSIVLPVAKYSPLSKITKNVDSIKIEKRSKAVYHKVLETLEFKTDDFAKIEAETKRSFLPLYRIITTVPTRKKPIWLSEKDIQNLIPAFLMGGWNGDIEGDKTVVELLTGLKYEDYIQVISKWLNIEDAPLFQVFNIYQIVSVQDMWTFLYESLTYEQLRRFRKCAIMILATENPKFELPEEQWSIAPILGKSQKYSGILCEGMTISLILLSEQRERENNCNIISAKDYVYSLVGEIFNSINTWKQWNTLTPLMTHLAEASPAAFLEKMEQEIANEQSEIWNLFKPAKDIFMGSNYYTHILLALEYLVWYKSYAVRAIILLVKINEKNFKDTLTNSPIDNLYNIFCLWYPQSCLNCKERIELIKRICKIYPNTGELLISKLMPTGRSSCWSIQKPRWHSFEVEFQEGVTRQDYFLTLQAISDIMLNNAVTMSQWNTIIKNSELFFSINVPWLASLEEYCKHLSENEKNEISSMLRSEISRNRKFCNSDWAIPEKFLKEMEAVLKQLTPKGIQKYEFLFKGNPELLRPIPYNEEKSGWEEKQCHLYKLRLEAIHDILENYGADDLIEFSLKAVAVKELSEVIISKIFHNAYDFAQIIRIKSSNYSLYALILHQLYRIRGLDLFLKALDDSALSNEDKADMICQCPLDLDAWRKLEGFDNKIVQHYWEHIDDVCFLNEGDEQADYYLSKLLLYKRPFSAVRVISFSRYSNSEMIINILRMCCELQNYTEPIGLSLNDLAQDAILDLFNKLYNDQNVELNQLVQLEIAFFSYFRFDFVPNGIIAYLLKNPVTYVELITYNYKADFNSEFSASKYSYEQRHLAYQVINFFKIVPGCNGNLISEKTFIDWISIAQGHAEHIGYMQSFFHCFGCLLSYAPVGSDGIFPHEIVRDYLEQNQNEKLVKGFVMEKQNQRGVYLATGGLAEKEISQKYREDASTIRISYPYTAAILEKLADCYQQESLYEQKSELLDFRA